MKKRLLSGLLTLCMALCIGPANVFAESETEEAPVCICETACTEGSMNTDCAVCGEESALVENCGKYTGPAAEDAAGTPESGMPEARSNAVPAQMNGEAEIRSESELEAALDDETRAEIKLGGNIEFSGGFIISRTVTLDLNGYTLTSSGTEFDMFSVYNNGNLTIKDSGTGGKIDGQNKNCGFDVSGGTLTLDSGSIVNCTDADGDGGAVDVSSKGKFTMNGGAVNIYKDGSFTMTGGTIKDCTVDAGGSGNAVYGDKNKAIVAISGGTIENCGVSPLSFDAFTVHFDTSGGTPVADQKLLNSPAVRPNDPEKSGCSFEGWYVGETPFDFSVPVTENTTVTAKWSECKHTGGTATCKDKAKCELCGTGYGELDPKNHTDFRHFPAKAATKAAEGNIEYWYCSGCGKYFSDKDGTTEIKKADTVTAKLKDDSKIPQTGDNSDLTLWIALLLLSGGAMIGTTVVSRKKKYNR